MIKQETLRYFKLQITSKRLRSYGLALFLLFIMVGCGKSGVDDSAGDAVSSTRALTMNLNMLASLSIEDDTSPKAETVGDKTTVKLLKRGAEPRKELRYKFQANKSFKMVMEMDMAMAMEMGTFNQPEMQLPISKMLMTFDCKEISPEGDLHYEFKLEDIEVLSEPGDDPMMVNAIKQQMSEMQGMTGSATVSTRGFTKDAKVIPPKGISPQTKQLLDSMSQSINQMSAPFPKEPVGRGAVWQVTMPMDIAGMKFTQIATYALSEMKGDNVKMDVAIKQSAPQQEINNPNTPAGMKTTLDSLDSSGKGTINLDLANLIPTSNMNSTSITAVTANGQKVKTTMKMEMKIYPVVNETQPSNKKDTVSDIKCDNETEENLMQVAKTECEILMAAAMPFAGEMLVKHHEFYPFGFTMANEGQLSQTGSWTGGDNPESTEVIKSLEEAFRKGAKSGEYKATVIVYDFLTIPPGKQEKQDAIAMALDHRDNYSVFVVYPYSFTSDGQLAIEDPFAVECENKIFGQ